MDPIMGVAAGSLALVTAALTLASIAVAARRFGRRPIPLAPTGRLPAVTIVRPLCGLEPFSVETLRSGFRLDYPDYELILCVASSADPILPVARRVAEAHPGSRCRILIGDDRISQNPKLNNCVKGWEAAGSDWIILADSNVLMPADYIRRMLAGWRETTGLVCSTPAGSRPVGLAAAVECAFLNTLQARWQYAGEAVGFGFAQGKSMLWYRPFLERHGGIRALASDIAEDAAATKLVREAGMQVHLATPPFEQPLGSRRWIDVWNRQLRWARLRRVTFPLFFAPEILSGAAVPGGLAAIGAPAFGLDPLVACLSLLALWYGAEAMLARMMRWPLPPSAPLAFALRDLMIPALWVSAFLTRRIVWRGNAMNVETRQAGEVGARS